MSALIECGSCGGLLPEGKRCCPHCHCQYTAAKRWKLAAAAALGLGAASCDATALKPNADQGHVDQGVEDLPLTGVDQSYGVFIFDLKDADAGTE